jgi:hypothetical protein
VQFPALESKPADAIVLKKRKPSSLWTKEEDRLCAEGWVRFGNDYRKIEEFMGKTRSVGAIMKRINEKYPGKVKVNPEEEVQVVKTV